MNLLVFLQMGGEQSGMLNLVFMALMFVVMYFFFLRPQIRKQKEANLFSQTVKVGNEIVTSSGIIGKILKMDEKEVLINTGETKLRILRSAISKELTEQFLGLDKKKKK